MNLHTVDMLPGSNNSRSDRLLMGLLSGVASPASANAITLPGTITPGTGFTNIKTVSIALTAGTGSGGSLVPASLKAVTATVVSGGTSGFVNGDTITLANGVVLTVASVSSGVVLTATVSTAGAFTGQVATNPVAQTATSGSAVGTTTWNLAYGLGAVSVANSGNYSVVPTGSTVTDSASGTGASIGAPTLGGNGNPVAVFVPFSGPASYGAFVAPGLDCRANVPSALKTSLGFTVLLEPLLSSTTLAAGTFDVLYVG